MYSRHSYTWLKWAIIRLPTSLLIVSYLHVIELEHVITPKWPDRSHNTDVGGAMSFACRGVKFGPQSPGKGTPVPTTQAYCRSTTVYAPGRNTHFPSDLISQSRSLGPQMESRFVFTAGSLRLLCVNFTVLLVTSRLRARPIRD